MNGWAAHWRPSARWAAILTLSVMFSALLAAIRLPAALLLGPMLAGIVLALGQGNVAPWMPLVHLAQGAIGCLVARSIDWAVVGEILHHWPLFLGLVLVTMLASCLLGYAIGRFGTIPGATPIWGMMPGAAPAMMMMAEESGANAQLVAFMQYVRVVMVAATAALVSRMWIGNMAPRITAPWFPVVDWSQFAITLGVIAASIVLGRISRIPAGIIIAALSIGIIVHLGGRATIELPPLFLAASYVVLGWHIGLRFTAPVIAAAARALPQTLAAVIAMIAFCGGLAALLSTALAVDPLSAYLATSPGGLDSVAIIAASTHVDVPFVMALQTLRFFLILLLGPWLARIAARTAAHA